VSTYTDGSFGLLTRTVSEIRLRVTRFDPTFLRFWGASMNNGANRNVRTRGFAIPAGLCLFVFCVALGVQAQTAPRYRVDPEWPKPLPNRWRMGGVTGLVVDVDDDVWVLSHPSNAPGVEKAPAMIHLDKQGNVINSFDARPGHGIAVDNGYVDAEFVYAGSDTIRRYDAKDGKMLTEMARVPEALPQAAAMAAFRAKYPPATPRIVGDIEEIRLDPSVRELYCTDNYVGGRVMVFSMDTFQFKRGWGAYGKPLSQISSNDADHAYAQNGPVPKEFTGHLSLNLSSDGLVYIADRIAKRIQVTDKQGKFVKEFNMAPSMGVGGSIGGIAFSADRQQRYVYIADSANNTVWALNREDGRVLGRLGGAGDGGQFQGLHMIAVDSKGNMYTGEVQTGERVKRFVPVN